MFKALKRWIDCTFRRIHIFNRHLGKRMECPDGECILRQGLLTHTDCCQQWVFIHVPWEELEAHDENCPDH